MFHPSSKAFSINMLHLRFPANCYWIKPQQPYPQLHQGLLSVQSKPLFSFPWSPLKSKVIRSRLKVDYSKRNPYKNQPTHPKAPPIPNRTFLNPQSLGHFISIKGSGSLSHSLQTGSPVCSVALCVISLAVDRSRKGVSCDNRITQVETRAGGGDR